MHMSALSEIAAPPTVVTLWRTGWSASQAAVMAWLQGEDWEPGTKFLWSAPSGSETMEQLERAVGQFPAEGEFEFEAMDAPSASPNGLVEKHALVAGLYMEAVQRCTTEKVLFLEDDNLPLVGAYPRLRAAFERTAADVAAIMGIYRSRRLPAKVCARNRTGYLDWHMAAAATQLEVEWLGGGFTLYRRKALVQGLPYNPIVTSGGIMKGWDVVLCEKLRREKFRFIIDGTNRVAHACPEVISWCRKTGQAIS